MAPYISEDVAALIGFVSEAILYGINVVMFFTSMNIILSRRRLGRIPIAIACLNLLLFLSCTTHFSLEFGHFHHHIINHGLDGFANETTTTWIADMFISVTNFIGDVILLYRCWVIWSRNIYVVIVPFLASIGGLVCASVVAWFVWAGSITGSHASVSPMIIPVGLASFVLPLCVNVITTTLIIARICHLDSTAWGGGKHVARVMLQSGVLYALVQLVFVALYAIQHPAQQIVVPMAVQIYGIASIFVIVSAGSSTPAPYAATVDEGVLTSWSELIPGHTHSSWVPSYGSLPRPGTSRAVVRSHTKSITRLPDLPAACL